MTKWRSYLPEKKTFFFGGRGEGGGKKGMRERDKVIENVEGGGGGNGEG